MSQDKILTRTPRKIIIQPGRLNEVLDRKEIEFFNKLVGKIEDHQKKG